MSVEYIKLDVSLNCLKPLYPFREGIIQYLKALKQEYLTTHEYVEVLFKKKA